MTDDPYLPLAFSLAKSPGAYAVLAGAGVSKGAAVPSAWDIEVDIVRQIAQRDNAGVVIDNDNAEQWYSDHYQKDLTYSEVVEEVAHTAHERQALLRPYFESVAAGTSSPLPPSAAHHAIARLVEAGVIRVIVTMNFDQLFELALIERGIRPTIVGTEDEAAGLGPLRLVQACVIHLHGDYLNPAAMLNTAAELSGYEPNMNRLLRHVLEDYGLIVAGWSVQHDTALREAVTACCTRRFTMGWVEPGRPTTAAQAIIDAHSAEVFETTADNAFAHLADQVFAIQEKQARHPLTVTAAASRVKRYLSQQSPAISAHDLVAEELNRLRDIPEFNLSDYHNSALSYANELRGRVIEATRVPVAVVTVLSYWGGVDTDRWWTPDVQRLARVTRRDGVGALINLPLVAASMLFYAAGVALGCAENYARLAKELDLVGEPVNQPGSVPLSNMLAANSSLIELMPSDHFQAVSPVLAEALGLGLETIEDAWQLFEILRLATELMRNDQFSQALSTSTLAGRRGAATASVDPLARARAAADIDMVLAGIVTRCHPTGLHLFAAERVYGAGTARRWASPTAERLVAEVDRERDLHPLVIGLNTSAENLTFALQVVSRAIGQAGETHAANRPGPGGWLRDELWLDS